MKILCITNGLYPYQYAPSACMFNLLGNNNVDYLTHDTIGFEKKGHPSNIYYIPNSRKVLYTKFNKILNNPKLSSKLCGLCEKLGIIKNITGDYYFGNINPKIVLNYVSTLIEKNHYDVIISVSMALINHYIARMIKDKYPEIKWVVYEADPYVYNCNLPKHNLDQRKIRANNLYRKVDAFLYMPGIKEFNQRNNYNPYYHNNSIPLELARLKPFTTKPKDNYFNNTKLNIVFTGNFYKDIRNPELPLELLNKLNTDYVLHLYGCGCEKIISSFKNIYKDKMVIHGQQPTDVINDAIANADILLNIGNSIENQTPSKIFDYFSTGKPIINIYSTKYDTSLPYMKQYGNALNIFIKNNPGKNILEIENFISNVRTLDYLEVENRLKDCTINVLKEKLHTILDSLFKSN